MAKVCNAAAQEMGSNLRRSGLQIGNQLAFQIPDHVLDPEFAPFHPRHHDLIDPDFLRSLLDSLIQLAVFAAQSGNLLDDVGGFGHWDGAHTDLVP